jgi:DNA-directed RNA polymerase specialized sigma24 family protein
VINTKSKVQSPKPIDAAAEVDRELARRIVEGDRDALARWLDRHLGAVYGYLMRRLGRGYEEVAADVTRATFSAAMRRLKPYARGTASAPMRLWLLKLAGEHLADEHITREVRPPKQSEVVALVVASAPTLAGVREAIGGLPMRQQAAISMALFEGMAAEEIAAASGRRLPGAMRELRSALKRTGRLLEAQSPDEP